MKKRFPALLWTLLFCLLLTLSSFAEDAPQVSDSDLLARARTLGILDGFSDESPEKPITRREFCVLTDNLLTSLGMTTGNPMRAPFEDTFDPAVMGLYVAGIVKGTSETTFSPDAHPRRRRLPYRTHSRFLPRRAARKGGNRPDGRDSRLRQA